MLAHSTVMPSWRIIAMNRVIEKKMAMAVRPYVTPERSSTKERSDDDTSNQKTSPALSISTVAQRTEIRMKNRRTKGRLIIAGSIGQKSWAKRCVKGRPTSAETKQGQRDHDGTGRRLGKVNECAPRDEGNHRPQGDEYGPEQQQHGYPLAPHQAPTQRQIGPGERRDQCTFETGEDEEQIEQDQGTYDALEHDGKRVAKCFARRRQQKQRTFSPVTMRGRMETE